MEQNKPEAVKYRLFPGWIVAVASAVIFFAVSGTTTSLRAFLMGGICIAIGLVLFMMLRFPRSPDEAVEAI